MKRGTILIWILSVLLAANNLLFLSGDQRPAGFWFVCVGLLLCYSLPFLALSIIRIPPKPSLERYIILTLFILIFIISIVIPIRRFLPGYHSASLEGVAYVFIPILESGLIGLFLFARYAISLIRLFSKGDLRS